MRGTVLPLCAGALVVAMAGCTPGTGYTGQSAYTPSPAAVFLAEGSCAARGGDTYRQVACDDPAAVARVTLRRAGDSAGAPRCPATTDFVLDGGPGYACMRDLRAPHPGDPGGGGGPNTIVGDCVYQALPTEARETACDGTGARPPGYKVTAVVTDRSQCPATTLLYVGVSGGRVGCAAPVGGTP